jgi:hypothetical protein
MMENKIVEALKELCIPMGNSGFRYIKTAVTAVVEDEEILGNMTRAGGIYDTVAKKHGTTIARAERAIRHGAEISAMNAESAVQEKYFGKVNGKVRNADFIAGIAFAVKMQTEE